MGERVKDMTKGRPARLIVGFALPLMLGNMFQQLYTMVDAIVVGQGVGVEALAALGSADWPNWLVTGLVIGFTQGFSIRISQRFGAEDYQGLRKTAAMSILLTAAVAVVFTILSLSLSRPVLILLDTPANVFDNALLYLRIIFAGIPIILGYNVLSAFLRALGDSRTPLVAMIIAACINTALDLLFVMVFHWGVAGAAIATVFAQFCSCVFCFYAVRRISFFRMEKSDWQLDWRNIWDLIKLGSPTAFQNGVIGVGGLAVQYVINGYGFLFVAGFTATNKLYGLLEIAASSFGYSMTTYVGQNLGAGKIRRVKTGLFSGCAIGFAYSIVAAVVLGIFGSNTAMIFLDAGETAIASQAGEFLRWASAFYVLLTLVNCVRFTIQGLGYGLLPMMAGVAELVGRGAVAVIAAGRKSYLGVCLASPAAWILASLLLIGMYYYVVKIDLKKIFPDKYAGNEKQSS